MQDGFPQQPDFTELAKQAFAANGYIPSDAVRIAAAKNLSRLTVPPLAPAHLQATVSFDDMLRSCAHA